MDKEIEAIRKRRREERRGARVKEVMEATGWSEEKALEEMNDARKNYKISFNDYSRYRLFQYEKETMPERYAGALKEEKDRKKQEEEREAIQFRKNYIRKVMDKTGWTETQTEENIEKARKNVDCPYQRYFYKEYFLYRMYEMSAEEQKNVLLWDYSRKISQLYDVRKSFKILTDNKEESNTYFARYMKRPWCVNRNISCEDFAGKFESCKKIIYKPLNGHRGEKIETIILSEENIREVYRHLMEMPEGIVEEYVEQHHMLRALSPSSLNTIRVVTVVSKSTPVTADGRFSDIAYMVVRIGNGMSIVDNLHAGGMTALIDLESGTIITDGGDGDGNIYKTHPVSGVTIKGTKIPFFSELKEMVYEMCDMEQVEGYLGWDIGVTEHGPVFIEVNANPGIILLNTSAATKKMNVKPVMEKYLSGNHLLGRYEIKKPDYDIVNRNRSCLSEVSYSAIRYRKVKEDGTDNSWTKKRVGLKSEQNRAVLLFTGDITCFEKQMEAASVEGGYHFEASFDAVKDIFAQSDLAAGNLETMIVPQAPYRNEKYVAEQNFHCNAPVEFLDALRNAGVDLLTNANNHDLDTGAPGIGETIDQVRRFGFIQTGTFKDNIKRYVLLDVNGITMAVLAFTTQHNKKENNLTEEGRKLLLNTYEEERAEQLIREAREDGAEVVIVCMHWGEDLKTVESKAQRDIAATLADFGADCIIGSHSHVLQPFSYVKARGKRVPVFYCLGNFISHNTRGAKSRSAIACIELQKREDTIHIACSYLPVHTAKAYHGKKFVVLPIREDTTDRVDQTRLKAIQKILGGDISLNHTITYAIETEDDVTDEIKTVGNSYLYEKADGYIRITGLDSSCNTLSYSIPATLEDLPVRKIASKAFMGNPLMKKINFGRNVEYVSEQSLKDCPMLEGFQLGRNISEIKYEAFANCTSLACAVMGSQVRRIASRAFAGCANLRSVKLAAEIEYIEEDAFLGCDKAVFYCPERSYAEKYAKRLGFKVINIERV